MICLVKKSSISWKLTHTLYKIKIIKIFVEEVCRRAFARKLLHNHKNGDSPLTPRHTTEKSQIALSKYFNF